MVSSFLPLHGFGWFLSFAKKIPPPPIFFFLDDLGILVDTYVELLAQIYILCNRAD